MIIAIDFDGTCVTHSYPYIGYDIGATEVLKELVKNGHELVLTTIRCDEELEEAIEWFNNRNIKLTGIQKYPTQEAFTSSPKVLYQLLIDDRSLGIPLKFNRKLSSKYFVDWEKVKTILKKKDII